VDPDRANRDGPKGYPPSSIFRALLLMCLLSMDSVLELVRFLREYQEWLVTLDLKRRIKGKMVYKVPDRSTFYKFAGRLGSDKIAEIFTVGAIRLIKTGVIKGEKVSLDCSIILAWCKDCPSAQRPNHDNRKCRKHRHRDASQTWDHHREACLRMQGTHRHRFGYRPSHNAHSDEGRIR
jgi:transposase